MLAIDHAMAIIDVIVIRLFEPCTSWLALVLEAREMLEQLWSDGGRLKTSDQPVVLHLAAVSGAAIYIPAAGRRHVRVVRYRGFTPQRSVADLHAAFSAFAADWPRLAALDFAGEGALCVMIDPLWAEFPRSRTTC